MKPKGRPRKSRTIKVLPRITQFSPRSKPGRPDDAVLNNDELEVIRLADHLSLSQKDAAKSMGISQQTFSRILNHAHKVISDALVNGKIIRIQETR